MHLCLVKVSFLTFLIKFQSSSATLISLPYANTVLVILLVVLLSLPLLIPELSVIPSRARFESVHCT